MTLVCNHDEINVYRFQILRSENHQVDQQLEKNHQDAYKDCTNNNESFITCIRIKTMLHSTL